MCLYAMTTTFLFAAPYLPNPCKYLHNPYIARNCIQRTRFPLLKYGSICIQIFVVGSERQACNVIECIMTVQGHPRSLIFTPIESSLSTSYKWSIVTLVVSCTVVEILTLEARNSLVLPTPPCFEAPLRGNPSELRNETYPRKTRGMELL